MGAILALHLAVERPREVAGVGLYGTTFRYDGWAMPWSVFWLRFGVLSAIGHRIFSRFYHFTEVEPYGIKDPAIRAVVLSAMTSGDTTRAGILVTPGAAIYPALRAGRRGQARAQVDRGARRPDPGARRRHGEPEELRVPAAPPARAGRARVILDDSYHIVTVDRQRDLVIEASAAFGSGLSARRAKEAETTIRPLRAVET